MTLTFFETFGYCGNCFPAYDHISWIGDIFSPSGNGVITLFLDVLAASFLLPHAKKREEVMMVHSSLSGPLKEINPTVFPFLTCHD